MEFAFGVRTMEARRQRERWIGISLLMILLLNFRLEYNFYTLYFFRFAHLRRVEFILYSMLLTFNQYVLLLCFTFWRMLHACLISSLDPTMLLSLDDIFSEWAG